MTAPIAQTDNLLEFRNSQGTAARGTLMHLSRQSVVFEVYNPYSIVQLSEVLTDLRIHRSGRHIYQGRAVVSNLVSTGLMLIVSATLVDPWSDLTHLIPGEDLRREVRSFVVDCQRANESVDPTFRLLVGTIRDFLEEFSQWLSQGEMVAGVNDRHTPKSLIQAFTGDVESETLPRLGDLFREFEHITNQLDPSLSASHKAYFRRELHPLLLCSPFIHRTFTKPLGYAGDYEMVNMIFRDRWEGANTYARVVNAMALTTPCAQGHRNRIEYLLVYLDQEAKRLAANGRPLRVLNVACGPAIELQRFIRSNPLAERSHLHLLDFNAETLAHTGARIDEAISASGRRPGLEFIHKSIHDLLKEARDRGESAGRNYDLVYCAGLFDYLSDRVCSRLIELFSRWVAPGGLMVATNVHSSNPVRNFMEYISEWNLVHRDETAMRAIASSPDQVNLVRDPTGSNIFLEVRRSQASQ